MTMSLVAGLAMDIPRSPPRSSSAPGVVDVLKKDGLSTLDECLQDEPKEVCYLGTKEQNTSEH